MEIDKVQYPAVVLGGAPAPDGCPTAEQAVETMLDKFCQWLRLWQDHDGGAMQNDPTYRYTPKDFYQRRILAAYDSGWYWAVAVEVYDGDEGGTTCLTGYFSTNRVPSECELCWLCYEFDTELQFIYDGNKLLNTPDGEPLLQEYKRLTKELQDILTSYDIPARDLGLPEAIRQLALLARKGS